MGLDLYVAMGDEEFFAERMSSYMGFHEFRKAWAQLLGFDLDAMLGFGGTQPWTTEPLQCFFDHSDCEGEISWQDAEQILAEARKDAPRLPNYGWAFSAYPRLRISSGKEAADFLLLVAGAFCSKPVLTGT